MKKKFIIIGLIIISIIILMVKVWGYNDTSRQLSDLHMKQPSLEYVFVKKWGSKGNKDEQLINSCHIAIDKLDNIYISDDGNNRIQKFDSEGNFILKWGSGGKNDGQFDYPEGITIDFKGYVYVVDSYNRRIQKFNSRGKFILKWGGVGPGESLGERQFDLPPTEIASDQQGYIYVVDSSTQFPKFIKLDNHSMSDKLTSRIQKFDSNGKFINQYYFLSRIISLAINPIGYIFLSNLYKRFKGYEYDICRYKTIYGIYPEVETIENKDYDNLKYISKEFKGCCLTTDKEGNLFVLDKSKNNIYKFDCDGKVLTSLNLSSSGDGQLEYPEAIAVDSKENVYVVDTVNKCIQKFKPVYY